jgi:hypothetical protein
MKDITGIYIHRFIKQAWEVQPKRPYSAMSTTYLVEAYYSSGWILEY